MSNFSKKLSLYKIAIFRSRGKLSLSQGIVFCHGDLFPKRFVLRDCFQFSRQSVICNLAKSSVLNLKYDRWQKNNEKKNNVNLIIECQGDNFLPDWWKWRTRLAAVARFVDSCWKLSLEFELQLSQKRGHKVKQNESFRI